MRRQLQAAFVLFHCAVVAVLSIPPPPPGMKGKSGNPEVVGAVQSWADAASSLGIDREGFVRAVQQGSTVWGGVLGGIQAPMQPYSQWTGAHQSWRMFGVVPSRGGELQIDALVDGAWVALYRPRSSEHDWHRRLLEQERTRALVNPFGRRLRRSTYTRLAGWLIEQARIEGIEAERVRVQMHQLTIPPPDELRRTGTLVSGPTYWVVEEPL